MVADLRFPFSVGPDKWSEPRGVMYIKSLPGQDRQAAFPSRVFSERRQFITCRSKVNAPMSRNGRNLYACLRAGKKSVSAGRVVENLSSITIPNNAGTPCDTVRHRVTGDHRETDVARAPPPLRRVALVKARRLNGRARPSKHCHPVFSLNGGPVKSDNAPEIGRLVNSRHGQSVSLRLGRRTIDPSISRTSGLVIRRFYVATCLPR